MQRAAFALGALSGAALAAMVAIVMGQRSDAPSGPESVEPRSAPSAHRDGDSDTARLHEEIAALRSELDRLTRSRERAPVDPDVRPTEASLDGTILPPVTAGSSSTETERLLACLDELFASGAVAERFRASPEELRGFLLETWLRVGRPDRALALLREVPFDELSGSYARAVAYEFQERDDAALAAEAFGMALRASPGDLYLVSEVAHADPDTALAALDRIAAERSDAGDLRGARTIALLRAGRGEEALAMFDAMLADGGAPEITWELLLESQPEAATTRLRAQLDQDRDNAALRLRLARSLQASGDDGAARSELLTVLDRNPDDLEALQLLGSMDSSHALQWIERRMSAGRGDDLWGEYGRNLEVAGRTPDAVSAYWRAFEASASSEWSERLLDIDPLGSGPRLIDSGEAREDDELLGDVADAYWRAGRTAEAARLWRRALQIDPGDGEWQGKVEAVAQGRPPL